MSFYKRALSKIVFSSYKNTQVGTRNEITRVEWLEKTIRALPDGLSILDAGAGEQQFKHLCGHLKYTSQDIAEYQPQTKNGLHPAKWNFGKLDIVSDIINIPVPDQSFDVIMCTEVLEHLPYPQKALIEFGRILKPTGYLILTAPFCSLTHFSPFHYATGFNKFFYKDILEELNFDLKEITPNGNYFEYLGQELQRLEKVAKNYSNDSLDYIESRSLNTLLQALERFSAKGNESGELLCFGYHVVARKK